MWNYNLPCFRRELFINLHGNGVKGDLGVSKYPKNCYSGCMLDSVRKSIFLLGLFLIGFADTVRAEPPVLEMPVRCTPGSDCWVVNYVDIDSGAGVKDYNCGRASYDTHKGVDIAIIDSNKMREGVPVYASAGGTVKGTRNNMRDVDFKLIGGRDGVKGKECGNGVLLDHGDGWTTQYCHMLEGSVLVKNGEKVDAGRQIGLIGMSGLTEFPHLHLQVKQNETVIDPFIGLERDSECGLGKKPLWSTDALLSMLYQPTAIYNSGFSSTTPNERIAREGLYGDEVLLPQSPVIALWTDMFWTQPGDKLSFVITGPQGQTLVSHNSTLRGSKAREFAFAGIKRRSAPWPSGTYTGEIRLYRPHKDEEYSVIKVINVK